MDLSPVGRQPVPGPREHGELAPESRAHRAAADVRRPGRVGPAERRRDRAGRPHPRARGRAAAGAGGPDPRAGAGAAGGDLPGLRRARRRSAARACGPRGARSRAPRGVPGSPSEPGAVGLHPGMAARRRAAARPAPLGGRALGRGGADLGRPAAAQDLPGLPMRLDLPGRHPERDAALVRHGGVRQPGQGPPVLCPPAGWGRGIVTPSDS